MIKQVQNKRTTFTTLDGQEIRFVPFSWDEHLLSDEGLKDEYRERGDIVDCPQYIVKFAGGSQQAFDHDEKSILKAPPDTAPDDIERVVEEQKETWAKYLDASARFTAETQAEMANLVYVESLAHITLPPDTTTWEARLAKKHIKIESDPEKKRLQYLNTEIVKYRSDQIDLMATVVAVSMGASREADIDTVKKSFLDTIWGNSQTQLPGRDASGKVEDTLIGRVDGKPETNDDPGSERVEINEG